MSKRLKFNPEREAIGKCVNGCNAPVCPPSKVICRACIDAITTKLDKMLAAVPKESK